MLYRRLCHVDLGYEAGEGPSFILYILGKPRRFLNNSTPSLIDLALEVEPCERHCKSVLPWIMQGMLEKSCHGASPFHRYIRSHLWEPRSHWNYISYLHISYPTTTTTTITWETPCAFWTGRSNPVVTNEVLQSRFGFDVLGRQFLGGGFLWNVFLLYVDSFSQTFPSTACQVLEM